MNSSNLSHTQNPTGIHEHDPEKSSKVTHKGKSSPRFLGVRQRPSGIWFDEIKDSSKKLRLWLGTSDRPEDAARAYDDAARLLRGRNAKANFPAHEIIHGRCGNLHTKNTRFYQLLHHAIMKNNGRNGMNRNTSCRGAPSGLIGSGSEVQETMVCYGVIILVLMQLVVGFYQENFGFISGASLSGGYKAHTASVHVALSFNASMYSSAGDVESCDESDILVHANGLVMTDFIYVRESNEVLVWSRKLLWPLLIRR